MYIISSTPILGSSARVDLPNRVSLLRQYNSFLNASSHLYQRLAMISEGQALLYSATHLSHHVTMAPLMAFINSMRQYLQHYYHLHLPFINDALQ